MFFKKAFLVALIAMASVLAGCSSDDDDSNTASNSPAGLAGVWTQNCTADDPEDAGTTYSTLVATFTNNSGSVTGSLYSDSGCTLATVPAEASIDFTMVFTGGTTATSLGAASHVDLTIVSATRDGQAVSNEQFLELSETDYDIFLIADGFIYSGDIDGALDGSTPQNRPNTLDTVDFLTRAP